MDGRKTLNGFDFYDDAIFNQQINSADFFKLQPVIIECDGELPSGAETWPLVILGQRDLDRFDLRLCPVQLVRLAPPTA